jgi:hypothetical protein
VPQIEDLNTLGPCATNSANSRGFSWLPLIVRRSGARERRQFREIDARNELGAQDGRDHAVCRAMGLWEGWMGEEGADEAGG